MVAKKPRFFFRRSQKIIVPSRDRQIIIPFRGMSVFAIFILLLSSIYLIFRSDLFLIHRIDIKGDIQDCSSEDEITRNLDILGRSLVFLNELKSVSELKSGIACIGEVEIKKKWPDKVVVEIKKRKGIAILSRTRIAGLMPEVSASSQATLSANLMQIATTSSINMQDGDLFLVDNNGFVLKRTASISGYPKIDISKKINFKIGEQIKDRAILTAINFLAVSSSLDFKISGGQINQNDKIIIFLDDGMQIILAKDKDAKNQAVSLQAIIREAKIEGEKLKSVDFSFDKPVLQMVKEGTKL